MAEAESSGQENSGRERFLDSSDNSASSDSSSSSSSSKSLTEVISAVIHRVKLSLAELADRNGSTAHAYL